MKTEHNTMNTYTLEKAKHHKSAFVSLFNIYAHELSAYESELTQINEKGNYISDDTIEQYCCDTSIVSSYVIMMDKRPIGFVVFEEENDNGTIYNSIEECFIIQTERKKGIMEKIFSDFLKDKQGVFTICVLKNNTSAVAF